MDWFPNPPLGTFTHLTSKESMERKSPANQLICSKCQFPLGLYSKAQISVRCPRCSTWLEIDPTCALSCMSCHKTNQAAPRACVEENVNPITNSPQESNNCSPNVVQTKRWANVGPIRLLKRAWKVLTNGLFL